MARIETEPGAIPEVINKSSPVEHVIFESYKVSPQSHDSNRMVSAKFSAIATIASYGFTEGAKTFADLSAAIDGHQNQAFVAAAATVYIGSQIGVMEMNRRLLENVGKCSNFVGKMLFDVASLKYSGEKIRDQFMRLLAVYAGTESTLIPAEVIRAELVSSGSAAQQTASIIAFGVAALYNGGLLIVQNRWLNGGKRYDTTPLP